MASRYRSISSSAIALLRSSVRASTRTSVPSSPFQRPFSSFSRVPSEMRCVNSLLPLHSAVSTARLTSCLDSSNSRSLSQEMGLSVPR